MKMVSFSCFSLLRQRTFRLLAAWLLLFGIATVAEAQMINFRIDITQTMEVTDGKKVEKKTETVSSVKVATFLVENRAKVAAAKVRQYIEPEKGKGDCLDVKAVKGGKANNVNADTRGYAVLVVALAESDTAIVIPIAKYYDEANNLVTYSHNFVLTGSKTMKEAVKEGRQKTSGDKLGSARRFGNKIVVSGIVRIDSAYARSDARFVGIPRLMEVDGNGKGKDRVVHYFSPMVFDGQPYEETQYRRMGYNLKNDKYDRYKANRNKRIIRSEVKHNGFRGQDSIYMETGVEYIFPWTAEYEPIEPSKRYNARLHRRFVDYNKAYRDDRDVLFWDGNFRDPMLFLDWGSAKSTLELDPTLYKKEEMSERSQSNESVKLEFESGQTNLNQNDSLTMAEMTRLTKKLHTWYIDPNAEVHEIHVKGYASPEGGYNGNKNLSVGRAGRVVEILRGQPQANKVKAWHKEADVVSWDEVADSLEIRIGTPEALEAAQGIREITSNVKGYDAQAFDAQWNRIKSATWYPNANDNVLKVALKMVRRVDITIEYVATRILSPEEIFEKYEKDQPKGYRQGIGVKDYQFYHLMNHLYEEQRWDELYTISKAAYDNNDTRELATRSRRKVDVEVTDSLRRLQEKAGIRPDTTIYYVDEDRKNPYYRPYTLAAYYLSLCKLRKEEADTLMLLDYIDYSNDKRRMEKNPDKGQGYGIWNEPAIVVNHILMHCYAKNISRAYHYALNWLPDNTNDPNYEIYHNLTMFVRCLNGEVEDQEVSDYIKSTSPMNHAVVAAAQDNEAGFKEALSILNDTSQVDYSDAKVHYLKAICRFRTQPFTDYEHPAYAANTIYQKEVPEKEDERTDFAAPMLDALRLNPDLLNHLETDGYFNDAYRRMIKYFWHCLQKGEDIATIANKYSILSSKIKVNK